MDLAAHVAAIAEEIENSATEIERGADAKEAGLAPGPFGMAIATLEGEVHLAGAADQAFPIQSIAKVLALELALRDRGEAVFERVGREPSGDPFNSVVDLERTHGVPRNPFINAGALVIVDMLVENASGTLPRDAVVEFAREQLRPDRSLDLDEEVLLEGGELNRAMVSFMRHHGNFVSDTNAAMEAYARQCAISVDCRGLALLGRFLADTRLRRDDGARSAEARRRRTLLALMMTCGHYDGSGDFAVRVGLPAKSGVGGGILAVAPGLGCIAAWSPNLDQHGNSILGVRALEMLAERTGLSVFGPPTS